MSPNELRAAGERLYGRRWHRPLAKALGVDRRTVDRWAIGQARISTATEMAIRTLIALRRPSE